MGSIPTRNQIFNIFISSLWCQGKARCWVPPLNTQWLLNLAEHRERNIVTLSFVWLTYYVREERDAKKKWYYIATGPGIYFNKFGKREHASSYRKWNASIIIHIFQLNAIPICFYYLWRFIYWWLWGSYVTLSVMRHKKGDVSDDTHECTLGLVL